MTSALLPSPDDAAFFPGRPGVARDQAAPFLEFSRSAWQSLAETVPVPLAGGDLARLASLLDPIDLREVDAVYRPLSALLQLHIGAQAELVARRQQFLQGDPVRVPFVIGIAGSVAVGKSTVARLLRELLSHHRATPHVELVTTDGFLLPNAELAARGLMERKGFPESYDRAALLRFVAAVKSGLPVVEAPVYSHVTYDIVPGQTQRVSAPDVLIIEGLNVLQPPRAEAGSPSVTISDFFDFSIYLDAESVDIEQWYVDRFRALRESTFSRADSYFHHYSQLSEAEAVSQARQIWQQINLENLHHNILPTRSRATLVLRKNHAHRIDQIWLRKI